MEFLSPPSAPWRKLDSATPAMLSDFLQPTNIPLETLVQRYPFLPLLQAVLGAVPNALSMAKQFPSAFTTENIIVPALLMLPQSCSSSHHKIFSLLTLC